MSGWIKVIGLGPGDPLWTTPQASTAIAAATDLLGYAPYLARIGPNPAQRRHASDNRVERERADHALSLASAGAKVAVISSGDPGIYAMAAAIIEAIEEGDASWLALDLEIIPGISAMQAAAARIGAPLGHDFCVISLSDNLKPWSIVEQRLTAAFAADFVVALYNPASLARPDRIRDAAMLAARFRRPATPVILARAIGSAEEKLTVTRLDEMDTALIDMRTLVLIGSSATRILSRRDRPPLVYTPRRYEMPG